MAESFAFPRRLAECYEQVTNCDCLNGDTSKEARNALEVILNEAQPKTSDEAFAKQAVRLLHRKNPRAFIQFLGRSKSKSLVLWTEGSSISRHFGLKGKAFLRWSNRGYYEVHKSNKSQSVPLPPPSPEYGPPYGAASNGSTVDNVMSLIEADEADADEGKASESIEADADEGAGENADEGKASESIEADADEAEALPSGLSAEALPSGLSAEATVAGTRSWADMV
jgi:hypothetical protein